MNSLSRGFMKAGFWWRRISDPSRGGFVLVEYKETFDIPARKFYIQLIQEEPFVHLDDIKIDRVVYGNTSVLEDRQALRLAVLSKLDQGDNMNKRGNTRMREQSGFSLLELVVAMAIGLIITAAGVFAYSTATRAAHQNSALESTLTVSKAVPAYINEFGTAAATTNLPAAGIAISATSPLGDSSNCAAAGPAATAACIAPTGVIASDTGYSYTVAYRSPSAWAVTSAPLAGTANTKSYCVDQSGTPTYSTTVTTAAGAVVAGTTPTCLGSGYTALGS